MQETHRGLRCNFNRSAHFSYWIQSYRFSTLNIMSHEKVGNKVRELRTDGGLTQAQLAELVGLAQISTTAIETRRFLPTIGTALVSQ